MSKQSIMSMKRQKTIDTSINNISEMPNRLGIRSARTRIADQKRARIKAYDEECKEKIIDHLKKQKVTQKLGLDFSIFENDDGMDKIVAHKEKTVNQVKNLAEATADKIKSAEYQRNSNKQQNMDTASNYSKQTGKFKGSTFLDALTGGLSPERRRTGAGGPFELQMAERDIIMKIDYHKSLKEPIPFGMSPAIWDLTSYKDNYEKWKDELEHKRREYDVDMARYRQIT